jgi:hypothetical protein
MAMESHCRSRTRRCYIACRILGRSETGMDIGRANPKVPARVDIGHPRRRRIDRTGDVEGSRIAELSTVNGSFRPHNWAQCGIPRKESDGGAAICELLREDSRVQPRSVEGDGEGARVKRVCARQYREGYKVTVRQTSPRGPFIPSFPRSDIPLLIGQRQGTKIQRVQAS